MVFYLMASFIALPLLRSITGYEVTQPNPITSYDYSLISAEEDPIELLSDYISLYKDVSLKIHEQENMTWINFVIEPNHYSVVFIPKNNREDEVNLLAYKMRSDILCEADQGEAEITSAVINTLFLKWKDRGYITDWHEKEKPEFREQTRKILIQKIGRAKTPLTLASLQQIRSFSIDWLKQHKKEIIKYALTAIISPIALYLIITYLLN